MTTGTKRGAARGHSRVKPLALPRSSMLAHTSRGWCRDAGVRVQTARLGFVLHVFLLVLAPCAAYAQQDASAADFDALARRGGRDSVRQIEERIQQGLAPPALARAIAALSRIREPASATALATLTTHRRASVRAQVAEVLGRLGDARSRPALADLLDDPDPRVRSAAALALGRVGARGVLDTLAVATARGVPEAAIVLGQQASASDVPAVLRRVDASSVASFAPTLRVMLERDDLPTRAKQAVVRALAQVGGGESERLLREIGATLTAGDPLRADVDRALEALTSAAEAAR